MRRYRTVLTTLLLCTPLLVRGENLADKYLFEPGHPSLREWLLPEQPPIPEGNRPTPARIRLGKTLFFDPRIGHDGNMSCASCHNPLLGWSDGLPTAIGHRGKVLRRASPVITNSAYNGIQMWDGRKRDLRDQATGPMEAELEMNTDMEAFERLLSLDGYKRLFEAAYPGEPRNAATAAKALAAFEWTIISRDSPFDRWVRGDADAMSEQQVRGFRLFVDSDKGNCAICHSPPNFTDDGFHNIGLASHDREQPDLGRYEQKPIRILRGAFKTPTLRDISLSAPYFHDGSSTTLLETVRHYNKGGETRKDLSPNIRPLHLDPQEEEDLVAFMRALTTPPKPFTLPRLPLE